MPRIPPQNLRASLRVLAQEAFLKESSRFFAPILRESEAIKIEAFLQKMFTVYTDRWPLSDLSAEVIRAIRNQLAAYSVSVPPADYLTDWETKLTLEHDRECRTTMQEFAVSIGLGDYYFYEEAVTTIHITMLEDLPLPLTSTTSLPTDHILKHVRQLYQNAFVKEAAQYARPLFEATNNGGLYYNELGRFLDAVQLIFLDRWPNTEKSCQDIREMVTTEAVVIKPSEYLTDWAKRFTVNYDRKHRMSFQAFAREAGYGRYAFYEEAVDYSPYPVGLTEEADHEETDNSTTVDFMAVRETDLANFEGWDLTREDEVVIDTNPSNRGVIIGPGLREVTEEARQAQSHLKVKLGPYLRLAEQEGEAEDFYRRFFDIWFHLWPLYARTDSEVPYVDHQKMCIIKSIKTDMILCKLGAARDGFSWKQKLRIVAASHGMYKQYTPEPEDNLPKRLLSETDTVDDNSILDYSALEVPFSANIRPRPRPRPLKKRRIQTPDHHASDFATTTQERNSCNQSLNGVQGCHDTAVTVEVIYEV
ncbi:hypothetical protein BDZ97DRAFT_1916293 [Flammula alnicola]|nr:hypothetical protein BDZ97DRAFT_1916293 [Flammula alnicola]